MTTITVLWMLLTRTEQQIISALKCWGVGACIVHMCFKKQIAAMLFKGKFSWDGLLELELWGLIPFGFAVLLLFACRDSSRPLSKEEVEAYEREEAEYRALLQESANRKAIDFFNRHRDD